MDDFKDAPVSIAEHRAQKAADGSIWTPRDALIELLRDIDSGKIDVKSLFMGYRYAVPGDEALHGGYSNACTDADDVLALLERTRYLFMMKLYGQ